ncbi:MAG: hypothetical protein KJ000_32090 [Pirellulaceae bacterium]|nr:hypothetical protein [Pirellulaceae bacterium]
MTLVALGLLMFGLDRDADAADYRLRLVTDNVPDYTDMASFVQSSTDAWTTPQEKCIAVWRWGRRSRRQTSCAVEDGRHILDPILHYNSYGAMNCGIISSLNLCSFLQLGYRGRYIQLGDHTVSEASWDDGLNWHLFDSSMSFFCLNHDGQVASCQEIKEPHACDLSEGRSEPGHFYLYHYAPQCATHSGPTGWRCASDQPVGYRRTLINGASSYTDGFSVDRYCQMARWGHRYTQNLRPSESYTRYWHPLDKPRGDMEPAESRLVCFRPMANGSDPDDQHGLNNLRGNGHWIFRPDLTADDCRDMFYDESAIALRPAEQDGANVHPAQTATDAWVVFKIYAANVITGMRIEATGRRGEENDRLEMSVSRDAGIRWQSVWQSETTGRQAWVSDLRDPVAGVTQCLIRVRMRAERHRQATGLDSIQVTTITQLNRRTLPKLTLGTNQIVLRADEQLETTELWPALHGGAYRDTILAEESVHSDEQSDGMYKATLGAGTDGRECSVTWRLTVPSSIASVDYGVISTNRSSRSYVSLQHSWDGEDFQEFHRNQDGDFPFDQQVIHRIATDNMAEADKPRQIFFRGVFFCSSGAATYNMPGIQDLLIRLSHQPRKAAFLPLEVTYHWTEHREEGDVTRSHTELVSSLPHRYSIHVAGRRDPTMHWVRMNLQGDAPDGPAQRYGYSDGVDVGPGWERSPVVYRWGRPLSVGRTYETSRPSDEQSGNPDRDGRELTNGIVIAPTDSVTTEALQTATAFWGPDAPVTFTVDLGQRQSIAGVRVTSHQPNARYCHPAVVEVGVSQDGEIWHAAGQIRHDDVFHPPGDFEPWEHDDNPKYDDLPAGGRLAYSYPCVFDHALVGRYVRFVCTPLEKRGIGLSELSVYGQAEQQPWPNEIAVGD